MRISEIFFQTQKAAAADESRGFQFLLRGGFVKKELAGVFSFLPIGLRILRKIEKIIRDEMEKIGSEILMPALAPRENWEKTGRWKNFDVLFKTEISDQKIPLSPSHEEIVTPLVQHFCASPKNFPLCVFQFQNKFRRELRAKSGLLRGREFLMKDAYSFHLEKKCAENFYEKMKKIYQKIFEKLGVGDRTFCVRAGGGNFSENFSHEFQLISDVGEDEIFFEKKTGEIFNREILSDAQINSGNFEKKRAIEVGNIFPLGTKYSDAFNFKIENERGEKIAPQMGCFGIGVSRLVGALAEIFCDDRGIFWPKNVAPAQIFLVPISEKIFPAAEKIYQKLKQNFEIFFDDRRGKKFSAGKKLADADLVGAPLRVLISENLLAENSAEIFLREKKITEKIPLENLEKFCREFFEK